MEIARRHGLLVIEDNAQCMLSRYKNQLTGTIGNVASYSFETTKHLSCGEGGMIITNDEALALLARKIGGHGFRNLKADHGRVRLNDDIFQDPNYKRHDVLGWNYRMSEFNAAVALAQLERVDELVNMRIQCARMFMQVMESCDYLIPQRTPSDRENSYYTLAVLYKGEESIGVSWSEFRKAYKAEGGDGFYGAWSVPYLEPMMASRQFVYRCPWVYENVRYEPGLCPTAERIQPLIMQFKTNYRDMRLAEIKAEALLKTIKRFKKSGKRTA